MNTAGLAAALGAVAIYAGMFAAGRAGAWDGLNGYDQTAIRFAVTTVLVLPFLWAALMPAARRIGIGRLFALFVLNGAPYSAVFLGGLVFAPVAYGAALVPGLQPVAVMVVALLWRGQRPALPNVLGAAICLGGVLVMLLDRQVTGSTDLPIGIGLFLLASAMWGTYTVALKTWAIEPREALATNAPLSALLYLPVYLLWQGPEAVLAAPASAVLLQAVYQGVLVGLVALILFTVAVKTAGSAAVAALAPAIPVLATLIGWAVLGERPNGSQWAGLVIVTIGLLVGTLWPMLKARQQAMVA
ncbi:MAG TPA: DMT family transporter [Geminicoccus sp.]|uniref:DMT family transporter n=1 Tax=Geminicoccus sp. TaxID=2024832 RepID=UPI002CB924D4|nr:DMT family transporter [Geminicoccus sp.]HWL72109.1 DMT family transporter [Geminicoccus sp.]